MKKKWNISILVIFILLASSLLGILSMTFVQQMMKQSTVVNSYYKAYYLSKAWIELGLAAIKNRGIGFEYTVNTWDQIVRENFFSGHNYSLSMSISGTASLLSKKFRQEENSGCQFSYQLSGGDSLVIPLFKDNYVWWVAEIFDPSITYQNLANIFKNNQIELMSEFDGNVTFWIMILSGNELSPNGMFFQTWTLKSLSTFKDQFETYLATIDSLLYPLESQLKSDYEKPWLIQNGFTIYLLISNSSFNQKIFCVSIKTPEQWTLWQKDVLPTDTFFLQSHASYGDQIVALDASYAQPIPWFLFNTYSELSSQ